MRAQAEPPDLPVPDIPAPETPRSAPTDVPPPAPTAAQRAQAMDHGVLAPPQPIAKGFHMGMTGAALGALALAITIFIFAAVVESPGLAVLGVLIYLAGAVTYAVMLFIHVYKTWSAIQDGYARSTPGKAIGFMFIPAFNFYWIFQAIFGFAQDYNRYLERHDISAMPLPAGLHMTFCVLVCCSAIPYLGILPFLASAGIWYFGILPRNINAVNTLAYNA